MAAKKKAKKSGLDKLHDSLDKVKKAPRRVLELGSLKAECYFEKDAKSGSLHMKFADCCVEVSNDDGKLGSVDACIGGGMEVNIDGYSYFIPVLQIWGAVSNAHEQWKKDTGR